MIRSCLNYGTVTGGARLRLRRFPHTPILAHAVVDACKAIFTANIEIVYKLVLYVRREELFNYALEHDEELLLLGVRWSCGPSNTLRSLSYGWLGH